MSDPGLQRADQSLLSRVRLFADIPLDRIEAVLAQCPLRRLSRGDVLLEPGWTNRDLFVLLDGALEVRLASADSTVGFAVTAGEFVGEMSVIDGQQTTAFVVAVQDSLVLVIHETVLWQQLGPTPGVIRNLLRLVSERLRARNEAMFVAQKQRMKFEEMERDLATARDLQASMLPRRSPLLPCVRQLEVQAVMEPAKEVGGDFYDAFMLDHGHACVVVGDVSGKGMPAALFMVKALTLLRAEARSGDEIGAVLARLNDALSTDNPSSMFVTVCAAAIDLDTGSTLLVSGGHDAPLARLGAKGWVQLPKPAGPLLGVIEGAEYSIRHLQLDPGDMLLLYTDGVTEAEDARRQHYTLGRLIEDLNRDDPRSADALVAAVRKRVAAHAIGQPQADDITLLGLRRPAWA